MALRTYALLPLSSICYHNLCRVLPSSSKFLDPPSEADTRGPEFHSSNTITGHSTHSVPCLRTLFPCHTLCVTLKLTNSQKCCQKATQHFVHIFFNCLNSTLSSKEYFFTSFSRETACKQRQCTIQVVHHTPMFAACTVKCATGY